MPGTVGRDQPYLTDYESVNMRRADVMEFWFALVKVGAIVLFLLVGAYALGKAQRILANVDAGIGPILTHGAVELTLQHNVLVHHGDDAVDAVAGQQLRGGARGGADQGEQQGEQDGQLVHADSTRGSDAAVAAARSRRSRTGLRDTTGRRSGN